ncbi:cytosine/adenosine deaminase-related metal-dependent hydrolase [Rhodococcus sp. 27YEA15]|uniref:amidohydrolase family protein n=1 Tax=Rhodococcus sp. 27YEA15 TaxID=3156259 RepID=UPI003C7DB744
MTCAEPLRNLSADAPATPIPVDYDVVISGGRVVDPETGLDAVRTIGIRGRRIEAVSDTVLRGRVEIDATGRVVAPGFVDLHSHAQTVAGLRLQALDGVTTALELEIGAAPVRAAYRAAELDGRPVNVGFAASWTTTRARVFDGFSGADPVPLRAFLSHAGLPNWRERRGCADVQTVLGELEKEFTDGALGLGIALGYAPGTDPAEYTELARLAADLDMPTFTHARWMSTVSPTSAVEATAEIISAAANTGAHMHFCHLNSTTHRMADTTGAMLADAIARGARISTEAYPYGSGCTAVGAPFLAPKALPQLGITARSIVHVATGRRMTDNTELTALRAADPGALVIIDILDEENSIDRRLLLTSLSGPDTVIASDAMPPMSASGTFVTDEWPLPESAHSHPRGAGCYARTFRWLVRESNTLTLSEAVRRCALLPAQILQRAAPAMRRKGRIQSGADADLAIFDLDTITDRSTYTATTRPSTGMDHVLVGGEFVVRDGAVQPDAMPGQPVYGRFHHSN